MVNSTSGLLNSGDLPGGIIYLNAGFDFVLNRLCELTILIARAALLGGGILPIR